MLLLPYARITLVSPMHPTQLQQRLGAVCQPPQVGLTAFLEKRPEPLFGEPTPDGFRVWRNVDYRNSFQPVFRGKYRVDHDRTVIDLTVTLHPIIIAFMTAWMGLACLMCLALLSLAVNNGFHAVMLFPLVFPVAGYSLTMFGFRKEFAPTLTLLGEALHAVPYTDSPSAYRG